MSPLTELDRYRRLQWLIVGAVTVGLLALGGVLFFAVHESRARAAARRETQLALKEAVERNTTALIALCFQRADVDARIADSEKLLRKHRHAKLIFAIPRTVIEDSLARDKHTRQNLEILDCKEQP